MYNTGTSRNRTKQNKYLNNQITDYFKLIT